MLCLRVLFYETGPYSHLEKLGAQSWRGLICAEAMSQRYNSVLLKKIIGIQHTARLSGTPEKLKIQPEIPLQLGQ